MIACLCLAIPVPLKYFDSASASAAFTTIIFSASARSFAATLCLCAALISFIAFFTLGSGAISVTNVEIMLYPNSSIDFANMFFTSIAISSFDVKTSSNLILGTVERTTSKMYERICPLESVNL